MPSADVKAISLVMEIVREKVTGLVKATALVKVITLEMRIGNATVRPSVEMATVKETHVSVTYRAIVKMESENAINRANVTKSSCRFDSHRRCSSDKPGCAKRPGFLC